MTNALPKDTITPTSDSVQRVQQAIRDAGFDYPVVVLPSSARTAEQAATALGCTVAAIAKSIIFKTAVGDKPILVLTSGVNRVNELVLAKIVGEAVLKADAAFVRAQTGFAIGGVAPVGHIGEIRTFIDEDLLAYNPVWAAAGSPETVFCITEGIAQLVPKAEVIKVA